MKKKEDMRIDMKMNVRYSLALPIDQVWARLRMVSTLHFVANPIVKFKAVDPNVFPGEWIKGDYRTSLLLFGFVPFGRHHIVIEIPETSDPNKKVLVDDGYGPMIKTWRHTITLTRKSDFETNYRDEVIIHAGFLTPFVWSFAWMFYRWRRQRWFKLIKSRR